MAIRLRTVAGTRVALCAAETDPMPGDVYLDDVDHYALAAKFSLDWRGRPDVAYPEVWAAMETQKLRDAREEHDRWERAGRPDPVPSTWRGEVCGRCNCRNTIGFAVSDDVWAAVSRGRWNVLCPTCFDIEAEAAGVPYRFLGVWPVSWSSWATGLRDEAPRSKEGSVSQ